jgi:hypothetical protein
VNSTCRQNQSGLFWKFYVNFNSLVLKSHSIVPKSHSVSENCTLRVEFTLMHDLSCQNHTFACINHTRVCQTLEFTLIRIVVTLVNIVAFYTVFGSHTLRLKVTRCLWKSYSCIIKLHFACINHTRARRN